MPPPFRETGCSGQAPTNCTHAPQEAAAKGRAARERMVREYSPEALGPFVADLIRRADAFIPA